MRGIVIIALFALAACGGYTPSSTEVEAKKQEEMKKQADQSVGMPSIVNWQEKRILKNILELRDQQIKTVTYTQDLNARLHKLCDSVGYGIPYATQYTNPSLIAQEGHGYGYAILPQADPNGLYSPSNAEGTWVMCLNPETKDLAPVYVEPRVIVSPFPLPSVS